MAGSDHSSSNDSNSSYYSSLSVQRDGSVIEAGPSAVPGSAPVPPANSTQALHIADSSGQTDYYAVTRNPHNRNLGLLHYYSSSAGKWVLESWERLKANRNKIADVTKDLTPSTVQGIAKLLPESSSKTGVEWAGVGVQGAVFSWDLIMHLRNHSKGLPVDWPRVATDAARAGSVALNIGSNTTKGSQISNTVSGLADFAIGGASAVDAYRSMTAQPPSTPPGGRGVEDRMETGQAELRTPSPSGSHRPTPIPPARLPTAYMPDGSAAPTATGRAGPASAQQRTGGGASQPPPATAGPSSQTSAPAHAGTQKKLKK